MEKKYATLFVGAMFALCIHAQINHRFDIKLIRYTIGITDIPYEKPDSLFFSDALYTKWYSRNLYLHTYESLMKDIYSHVVSDSIQAYDTLFIVDNGIPNFIPVAGAEIFNRFSAFDSLSYVCSEPPYETVDMVWITPFRQDCIVALDFLEMRTFDRITFKLTKTMVAWGPRAAFYSPYDGSYLRTELMFWIKN